MPHTAHHEEETRPREEEARPWKPEPSDRREPFKALRRQLLTMRKEYEGPVASLRQLLTSAGGALGSLFEKTYRSVRGLRHLRHGDVRGSEEGPLEDPDAASVELYLHQARTYAEMSIESVERTCASLDRMHQRGEEIIEAYRAEV